jgi:hypothetical protein
VGDEPEIQSDGGNKSEDQSELEPWWLPLSAATEFNRQIVEKFGGRHEIRNIAALKLVLARADFHHPFWTKRHCRPISL